MKRFYVYIITNKPDGVLYIGRTENLAQRIYAHKIKAVKGFSEKYNLKNLIYYEVYNDKLEAAAREKNMKKWKREWKINKIIDMNPNWDDLYEIICE